MIFVIKGVVNYDKDVVVGFIVVLFVDVNFLVFKGINIVNLLVGVIIMCFD